MGDFKQITSREGRSFDAYVAFPANSGGPGLIVLPEIFNVNDTIRQIVDDYASLGFVAMAPDMFWRSEPGLHMTYTRENSQHGLALYAALDRAAAVADVGACVRALRGYEAVNSGIGVMGFCMGGEIALLAGCRLPVDAVVIYYGTRMEPHLDELSRLASPTLMHFAERDPHVPLTTVDAIRERVAGRGDIEIHVYEGADHGFARPNHPQFQHEAAALAADRSRQWLDTLHRS